LRRSGVADASRFVVIEPLVEVVFVVVVEPLAEVIFVVEVVFVVEPLAEVIFVVEPLAEVIFVVVENVRITRWPCG
jgi:hypothetical protein